MKHCILKAVLFLFLLPTTLRFRLTNTMPSPVTKLCLDVEMLTDDFFEDTRLLGIVATIKNYQFCWHINSALSYCFRLNPEIEVQLKRKERDYYFRVYEHSVRNSFVSHYIYQNSHDGEYLLPECKHVDFLWLIKNESADANQCRELIASIRKLKSVQMVTELSDDKIRNKKHLIF